MDEETECFIGFNVFPGIGPIRFKLLLDYFGSAREAWRAPLVTLRKIKLGEKLSGEFDHFRKSFDLDAYISNLNKLHVSVLTLKDPRYPILLSRIPDAPFVLYVKGKPSYTKATEGGERHKIPLDLTRTVAVVGTRKITPYGEEVTRRLVEGLASYGCTIVSGLAYGVDAVAHRSAIDAGGKTIAVLGCGIDIIAPPSNARLYYDIADGAGAIVSEVPLGMRPTKGLFPARNRIISGLSLGVLVTEGADDSGALITARYAGEQGRDVFAVPGPITSPYSRGPAKLLKNGAKLVESVEDILEELNIPANLAKDAEDLDKKIQELTSAEEKKIAVLLSDRRMYIDEIVRVSGLTARQVGSTITLLEMKRIIKDYGEKVYGIWI
ncbi:MAG TPA: DNA-processing protein DprA [Patescibacteria group bacterium]|nr:DNA-processing protein DprA [Patescibacteria group bacterium]